MDYAFEKLANQRLKTDQYNWKSLLSHPSEIIRIDEQLRFKQFELRDFNEQTPGYNFIAAQTNLEHQRLIFSMRCYLAICGYSFFRIPVFSHEEFQRLKNSFIDRANFKIEQSFIELTAHEDDFWLIMQTACDKSNSEKFYKKIMGEVLSYYQFPQEQKEIMMETIIQKCCFTV
jgi:hypothetical protein